ncbi:hypothetical protein Efla_005986 [Eimeria flavescens]
MPDRQQQQETIVCSDTEEESDETTSRAPPPPQSQLPPTGPEAEDLKAPALAATKGASYSAGGNALETDNEDDQPSTSTGRRRKRLAGLQESQLPLKKRKLLFRSADDQPSSASPAEGEASGVSQKPRKPGDGSPAASAPSESPGIFQSAGQPAHSTGKEQDPASQPESRVDTRTPSDWEQPSTSAGVSVPAGGASARTSPSASGPAVDVRYELHPFFRSPEVNPVYQAIQRFNPERTTSPTMACRRLSLLMDETRQLLAKPSLAARDFDSLARKVEQLMAYGFLKERRNVTGDSVERVIYDLGRRYLLMDTVITGLQVLGVPPEGPWWGRFAEAVNHEGAKSPSTRYRTLWGKELVELSSRLGEALKTLKSGTRLSAKETVDLKRRLLCSPSTPRELRSKAWDAWRQDNEDFGSSDHLQIALKMPVCYAFAETFFSPAKVVLPPNLDDLLAVGFKGVA